MTGTALSTWDLLREAIRGGRTDEALELLEQGINLATAQQNSLASFVGMVATHLTQFGEEELEKVYRERYYPVAKEWISTTPGVEESVEKITKHMESPHSKITVKEEPDRYVVSLDPCRTGGRLIRGTTVALSNLPTVKIGTTKKAHPWCWGKSGVSYYCGHSCLLFEIIPIELRGYPIAVIEYPEKPEDPCVFLFYKKPELIPEEYFTRVGKTKTIK
ncbi:hypothetical protein ACFLVN_04990 [Chloroflexota bacterium]